LKSAGRWRKILLTDSSMTADMWNSAGPIPVERRAFPPAWTGETPVPPQPGLRESLYYSGREKAGN
jgi:hypothetical protein